MKHLIYDGKPYERKLSRTVWIGGKEVCLIYSYLSIQQILTKKNTYSLDINKRALKTNQITGSNKISRVSDADNNALSIIGADFALKEFLGPRAKQHWLLISLIAGNPLELIKLQRN